ncbi:uncharacterized protein LOC119361734 [Triticum dicoccoides]|uniref:uncharacterized protein LOC119361734 n=1 Tax=Triticum dicoccoides TaxID=85692 RepID=UPI00188F881F|nr:uncharacterized protein LOC119361734 [Triticum dicoccoides]
MEVAMSAVAGELVSRFISLLMSKYHSSIHAQSKEQNLAKRLRHLLMRVGTVVEEADGRYITNSGMLAQLKMLSEAMYEGYRVLDTLMYRALLNSAGFDEVSSNDSFNSHLCLIKRSRRMANGATCLESDDALESLEAAAANMAEFVMLLGGCERMSRRPYDTYLYTDNFMFSRHAEKQKLLSFLLQHNDPPGGDQATTVLPIIGGAKVGKKTLVAHACGDERVRARFSSVLHLNDDGLLRHGRTKFGMKMLVVIEFASDVGDDDWTRFHSLVTRMGRGSKIVIVSRLQRLARFGSVKPIILGAMSYDELTYLFKTLSFGSEDPAEHPQLVQIADEFAKRFHGTEGSLIATNAYADVLRRNLDVKFWRCILDKGMRMVKRNLAIYGMHPNTLMYHGHPVDITDFALHPLSMTPYSASFSVKKESPSVTFGDLITNPSVRPKGDFTLIVWESRIPPHKSFPNFVTSCAQDTHQGSAFPGRKRQGVPI